MEFENAVAFWAATVAERNLPAEFLDQATAQEIQDALKCLKHARLDRENISLLDPAFLMCISNLTSLYLQENELTTLNGIEILQELQFLTVSGNKITTLCGLQALTNLGFLDVSMNCVTHIQPETELPKSLYYLNVSKNPCCEFQPELKEILNAALPNLQELRVVAGSEHSQIDVEDDDRDYFLSALEILPYSSWKKRSSGIASLQEAHQNCRIASIVSINPQEALQDADAALVAMFENTQENIQQNFEKIQQRSQVRVHNNEVESIALKRIKRPSFKKPQLAHTMF